MSAPTIRFHFDFLSPYAYLAWTQIHALAERTGAVLEPAPVLLAALLNHHGQKGPAEIPAKRVHVFKDTLRRALRLGVPLRPPPTHPFNPLSAMRAVLAVEPPARRALIDALFAATWGDAPVRGLERPETIAAIATSLGHAPDALAVAASAPEIKAALRDNTERAIAAGVFGVPSMQVGDEVFWGLDSFDLLEAYVRGEDPLTPDVLARFADVAPSAER